MRRYFLTFAIPTHSLNNASALALSVAGKYFDEQRPHRNVCYCWGVVVVCSADVNSTQGYFAYDMRRAFRRHAL